MDANQIARENQAQLFHIGNTIIQGGMPKSSHGDVYAIRHNRYRDELDKQIRQKNAIKMKERMNDWNMDNMHLDTITYAPVGNPAVSSRRSNRMETSYQTQFISPRIEEEKKLTESQSYPVSFLKHLIYYQLIVIDNSRIICFLRKQ